MPSVVGPADHTIAGLCRVPNNCIGGSGTVTLPAGTFLIVGPCPPCLYTVLSSIDTFFALLTVRGDEDVRSTGCWPSIPPGARADSEDPAADGHLLTECPACSLLLGFSLEPATAPRC